MTFGDFKDLTRKTASGICDKAFDIAKNPKYDAYHRGLVSTVHKFLITKLLVELLNMKICLIKKLAEELHKPVIGKFDKGKVHSSFIDNIWVADLADMQLISKFNKGFRYLLCVIDIYSKYAWVILLKDKKELQLLMLSKNLRWIKPQTKQNIGS